MSIHSLKRRTLAEQLADGLKADILRGVWQAGDGLPTEPELSEQFGVSRTVVRDATRILLAWGLVDVQQGRGVFVTESQDAAFADALLLALQRDGATVWDVEQFYQAVLPDAVALAAQAATDAEIDEIERLAEVYLSAHVESAKRWQDDMPDEEIEKLRAISQPVEVALFAATHNRLFQRLTWPLLHMRNFRRWDEITSNDEATSRDATWWHTIVDLLRARDPDLARRTLHEMLALPAHAIDAMRATPVGKIPRIPAA